MFAAMDRYSLNILPLPEKKKPNPKTKPKVIRITICIQTPATELQLVQGTYFFF